MFGEATAQKSHCQTLCSSNVTWRKWTVIWKSSETRALVSHSCRRQGDWVVRECIQCFVAGLFSLSRRFVSVCLSGRLTAALVQWTKQHLLHRDRWTWRVTWHCCGIYSGRRSHLVVMAVAFYTATTLFSVEPVVGTMIGYTVLIYNQLLRPT